MKYESKSHFLHFETLPPVEDTMNEERAPAKVSQLYSSGVLAEELEVNRQTLYRLTVNDECLLAFRLTYEDGRREGDFRYIADYVDAALETAASTGLSETDTLREFAPASGEFVDHLIEDYENKILAQADENGYLTVKAASELTGVARQRLYEYKFHDEHGIPATKLLSRLAWYHQGLGESSGDPREKWQPRSTFYLKEIATPKKASYLLGLPFQEVQELAEQGGLLTVANDQSLSRGYIRALKSHLTDQVRDITSVKELAQSRDGAQLTQEAASELLIKLYQRTDAEGLVDGQFDLQTYLGSVVLGHVSLPEHQQPLETFSHYEEAIPLSAGETSRLLQTSNQRVNQYAINGALLSFRLTTDAGVRGGSDFRYSQPYAAEINKLAIQQRETIFNVMRGYAPHKPQFVQQLIEEFALVVRLQAEGGYLSASEAAVLTGMSAKTIRYYDLSERHEKRSIPVEALLGNIAWYHMTLGKRSGVPMSQW